MSFCFGFISSAFIYFDMSLCYSSSLVVSLVFDTNVFICLALMPFGADCHFDSHSKIGPNK